VARQSLKNGNSKSCGCYLLDIVTKHGGSAERSPEYTTWRNLVRRCYSPTLPEYKNYGARGIRVCDEWRNDFGAFLRDMGRRPGRRSEFSLDRIDVNADYTKENCRWATWKQQATNKRKMARIENFTTEELLAELRRRGSLDDAGITPTFSRTDFRDLGVFALLAP
jgi:hypothetical protein